MARQTLPTLAVVACLSLAMTVVGQQSPAAVSEESSAYGLVGALPGSHHLGSHTELHGPDRFGVNLEDVRSVQSYSICLDPWGARTNLSHRCVD